MEFEEYLRISKALATKVPREAEEKEEYRQALLNLCRHYEIPCKDSEAVMILKGKLKSLMN